MKVGIATLAVALVGMAAEAKGKKVVLAKGFWKILVKPAAKWVLHPSSGDPSNTITVETYDVRKVAGADVARLRWTHTVGTEKTQIGDSASGRFDQVGVTSAGLYLMSADMDDAKVTAWLAKKPSRSDPPKEYSGTAQNQGRFLSIMDDGTVCMGEAQPTRDHCEDTCAGEICFSATAGVVSVEGTYAPQFDRFTQ